MENITADQIINWLIRLAALIAALGVIYKATVKVLSKILDEKFNGINEKLDSFSKRLEDVDYNGCKNFLVAVISDIDSGKELSQTTLERFYENYDHYTKDCDGNGYIKAKVETLEQSGKLARFL